MPWSMKGPCRMYEKVGFDPAMVAAAMAGNQPAVDELVAACLPLVYNVVGRALGGHTDVDDVVQETMLPAAIQVVGSPRSERSSPQSRS